MTRGQIVTRVAQIMGMAGSGVDSAEELTLLQDFVNDAVLDILLRTKVHVRRTSLLLDAGITEYDLQQPVIRIWNLYSEDVELQEVTEGNLSSFDGETVFQFVGYNRLVLGWEPSAGDTLEAWYTPRPTKMTSDAHDPAVVTYGLIPEEFHKAIINSCCWRAGEVTRDQMSGMGEKFRRTYEGEDGLGRMGSNIGEIKMGVNRRGGSGGSYARIRRLGERSAADAGSSTWR